MSRYIEEQAVIKAIDESGQRYGITTANQCNFKEIVRKIPTADVVPKSEVEMLQGALKAEERHNELTMEMAQKALKNAKAEVAREIFEEIEKEIKQSLTEHKNKKLKYNIEDVLFHLYHGITASQMGMLDFIAELKKKYTGIENGT